jgi:hypothetical protein
MSSNVSEKKNHPMKTSLIIVAFFAMCFNSANAQAAHRVKILKIEGEAQQTPEFQISGIKDKPTKPRFWIEIEAEVEVETTDPSGFIPELEARWFAVIIDKQAKKPVAVRLQGSTTFKNIRTSDKKIFLSAYIEPDTLERLTGSTRPSENDIEGFALVLSGSGVVTEGRYGEGLTKATAEEAAKWWEIWKNQTLEGLIVPKSQTPFAPLWTDRYPTEKAPKN